MKEERDRVWWDGMNDVYSRWYATWQRWYDYYNMLCLLIEDIPMKTRRNIPKGKEKEEKAIETIRGAWKKINIKIKKKLTTSASIFCKNG